MGNAQLPLKSLLQEGGVVEAEIAVQEVEPYLEAEGLRNLYRLKRLFVMKNGFALGGANAFQMEQK